MKRVTVKEGEIASFNSGYVYTFIENGEQVVVVHKSRPAPDADARPLAPVKQGATVDGIAIE